MPSDQYIYNEPDAMQRIVYMDDTGNPHLTREDAIAQNIATDIERHLRGQLARAWPDDHDQRAFVASAIVSQLRSRHNRQLRSMVRDLIDATD